MKPTLVASVLAVTIKALAYQKDAGHEESSSPSLEWPCPTEIKTRIIPYDTREGASWSAPWHSKSVHNAMQMCPNIDELSLKSGYMGCGHEFHPTKWSFPFDIRGNERYLSAPRILDLEDYDFGRREWDAVQPPLWSTQTHSVDRSWTSWVRNGDAFRWIMGLGLSAKMKAKTNLELWLDAMDFSKVHTLVLRGGSNRATDDSFSRRLPAALSSLRSLTLDEPWKRYRCDYADERNFGPPPTFDLILALPPATLENITYTSGGPVDSEEFDNVIKHHGPSLKHLEWHSEELLFSERSTLSAEQLRNLANWAPNLQSLTIDLGRRDGAWPSEALHAVASMSKLTDLTIYYTMSSKCGWRLFTQIQYPDIDCIRGLNRFAQPLLNTTTANEMFNVLRAAKTGEKLSRVVFKSGDWMQPCVSAFNFPARWLAGQQALVECSDLKEDGTLKGMKDSICTGFGTDPTLDGQREDLDWDWVSMGLDGYGEIQYLDTEENAELRRL